MARALRYLLFAKTGENSPVFSREDQGLMVRRCVRPVVFGLRWCRGGWRRICRCGSIMIRRGGRRLRLWRWGLFRWPGGFWQSVIGRGVGMLVGCVRGIGRGIRFVAVSRGWWSTLRGGMGLGSWRGMRMWRRFGGVLGLCRVGGEGGRGVGEEMKTMWLMIYIYNNNTTCRR